MVAYGDTWCLLNQVTLSKAVSFTVSSHLGLSYRHLSLLSSPLANVPKHKLYAIPCITIYLLVVDLGLRENSRKVTEYMCSPTMQGHNDI